ncbi:hypothetical protein KIW84_062237 [Lathyrus oleraceus]|uniref:Uncharacterized protein n=1 Tax=Pisum sativum TaxID=3888 RepID=A0A9D5A3B9_PEA|nr:hypothetical protein KIW84_062237 [Pisum sativum]
MEQLEQNQETLWVDMDSIKGNMEEMKDKMDQLTRSITNMLARETEADKRKIAFMSTPPPGDGNPLQGFTSDIQGGEAKDGTLHPEGSIPSLVHNGAYLPVQIRILQDNYVDLSQQYEEEDPRGMVQENTCGKMKGCLQQMMNEGLVLIGYTRKLEHVSFIESQGHTPFDIPYQQVETPKPFQIPFQMSSKTSVQILVPIPSQVPFQIPVKSEDPIVFHVPAPFPFKALSMYLGITTIQHM